MRVRARSRSIRPASRSLSAVSNCFSLPASPASAFRASAAAAVNLVLPVDVTVQAWVPGLWNSKAIWAGHYPIKVGDPNTLNCRVYCNSGGPASGVVAPPVPGVPPVSVDSPVPADPLVPWSPPSLSLESDPQPAARGSARRSSQSTREAVMVAPSLGSGVARTRADRASGSYRLPQR